jgi:hypothetical protein
MYELEAHFFDIKSVNATFSFFIYQTVLADRHQTVCGVYWNLAYEAMLRVE